MPIQTGFKTVKNSSIKKSRNLYNELKNAMTEKLAKINDLGIKRNSLNAAQSKYIFINKLAGISSRGNTFEYTTFTKRPSLATLNVPKSSRIGEIKGKIF
jgi:hypothetical protein